MGKSNVRLLLRKTTKFLDQHLFLCAYKRHGYNTKGGKECGILKQGSDVLGVGLCAFSGVQSLCFCLTNCALTHAIYMVFRGCRFSWFNRRFFPEHEKNRLGG